jgi:Holliday junction resolvase
LPGVWTVKTIATNKRGTPDILACVNGQFMALEVKAPKGRPSKLQILQVEAINSAGGTAAIVYSVDDVRQIVDMINAGICLRAKSENSAS